MRTRIIYDPGEPVVLRDYPLEALALLDKAILEAGDIPSMIRYDRAGEIMQRTLLLVRREHVKEANELLSVPLVPVDDDVDESTAPPLIAKHRIHCSCGLSSRSRSPPPSPLPVFTPRRRPTRASTRSRRSPSRR